MQPIKPYLLILFILLAVAWTFADEEQPELLTQTNSEALLNDPFAYQTGNLGDGGFVPTSDNNIPPGIRVLAIIEVEDAPACAALHIPELPDTVYVKEDDVIRLENRNSPSPSASSVGPLYLLVQKVSAGGVEISPRERQSEVHIFQ